MTTENASQASYERVTYEAASHPHTHPTRIATMAHLMGLQPPSLYGARVLELGCATGTNLMAMAEGYPDAHFTGIDYSKNQIEIGRSRLKQTGLSNVALLDRSIADIEAGEGPYDYVIAHGVYSWIPAQMQAKLLQICRNNLSPNGLAYISYNVLPGWRMNGIIRDLMLFHVRRFPENEHVGHARAILKFLAEKVPGDGAYGQLIKDVSGKLALQKDFYLAHEYLERENDAVYFHEFVDRLRENDLDYLAEVELGSMLPNFLPADVVNVISQFAKTHIDYEQYLDFLRSRTFRQSIVIPTSAQPNRNISIDRLNGLHAFPTFTLQGVMSDLDRNTKPVKLLNSLGHPVDSADPLFKLVLRTLGEAMPMSIKVEDLVAALPKDDSAQSDADWDQAIRTRLLEGFSTGVLRLVKDPPLTDHGTIDPFPKASAVARVEASIGDMLTVKGHQAQQWDHVRRGILRLMDGKHSKDDLLDAFAASHKRGEFKLNDGSDGFPDAVLRSRLSTHLDGVFVAFKNAGLLRA